MRNMQRRQWAVGPAVLGLVFSWGMMGQDSPPVQAVRGPVLGYIADRQAGIQPVYGIAGAATLGPAVLPQRGMKMAVASPGGDYALSVLAETGQPAIIRDLGGKPVLAALDAPADPDKIVFSPTGNAAALYYSGERRVVVLTGLPEATSVAWSLTLPGELYELSALAVSDGGGVLLTAGAGEPSQVWAGTADLGWKFLYAASAPPKVAFLFEKDDAAVADPGNGEVVLIRSLKTEQQEFVSLGGRDQGISRPVEMAAARNNRTLFVVVAEPSGVVGLALPEGESYFLPCPCTATTLERMSGDVFRLSEPGPGPIWLLDAAGLRPRIVFAPEQMRLQRETERLAVPRRSGGDR